MEQNSHFHDGRTLLLAGFRRLLSLHIISVPEHFKIKVSSSDHLIKDFSHYKNLLKESLKPDDSVFYHP